MIEISNRNVQSKSVGKSDQENIIKMFQFIFYSLTFSYMTLRTAMMIGLIAIASTPLSSSAMTLIDGTVNDRNTTPISDTETVRTNKPIVTKDIVDVVIVTQSLPTTTGKIAMFRDDGTAWDKVVNGTHIKNAVITMKRDMQSMGSGGQMGSRTMMENDSKWLMFAVGALSPADRATLVKLIRDYLVSKGIDPTKYAEKRDDINEIRQEGRDEMMDIRKRNQEAMKAKRDDMRSKIQEVRANSKVNVQDISMTR
jgi:hypothetical protein